MQQQQQANINVFYDEHLLTDDPFQVFDSYYWKDKNAILGSAKGRGITWFVRTEKLDVALRHYYRGGLFGKLVADLYSFTGLKETRAYKEFELLAYLRDQGVPVPRPIAARVIRHSFLYQADLLSELIPNTKDLVAILVDNKISDELCREIGRVVRKLHNVGVCHTDLNIHNILIDAESKVWLIDFDKCDRRSGDAWKKDNLSRLQRSFNKEIEKRHIKWSAEQWALLLQGYNSPSNN